MIRGAIVVLFFAALISVALAMAGDPGHATLNWVHVRVDTSATVAAIVIGLLTFLAVVFWRLVLWIAEAPKRTARARAESRRRQAADVLTRGFLAIASGEGAEARRCAQRATELADDTPALVRILSAQSAEAAGDLASAQAAYSAMLGFPEMRLVGHRGLMGIALQQGDKAQALKHAQDAFDLAKTARWAWRALFEARLEAGQWSEALALVEGALKRKIVTPLAAERARAALLAANAAALEQMADPKLKDQALDAATRAAKLSPAFAPGAVMAARLLAEAGKTGRAEDVIEAAWAAAPHPALWLAWRDLRNHETPHERAVRVQSLIDRNPEHRESKILRVEQAMLDGDPAGLDAAVAALANEAPTQRLCGLMARAAHAAHRPDDASAWVARGSAAPQEPDWSDLDPEGRAFEYGLADWTRLVSTWTETGELLHPRFERRERTLSDLPELPSSYEASAPFVTAVETGGVFMAPLPDDPGAFDEALTGPAPEPPAPPRRAGRGRARSLGKGSGSV